jgi:hypothetical protein
LICQQLQQLSLQPHTSSKTPFGMLLPGLEQCHATVATPACFAATSAAACTVWLCLCAQSLAGSKREVDLEGRLVAITETLTSDIYNYTCLGLFERHKLMLSFQMAVKILETGSHPLDAQVGVCCDVFSAG